MKNGLNNNGMTARKQWCYDAAKEFVAKKQIEREYRIKLNVYNSYDENDNFGETEYEEIRSLSKEELAKYRAFQDKCWEEYKNDYTEDFDENGNYDEKGWVGFLEECYWQECFEDYVYLAERVKKGEHFYDEYTVELNAYVRYVDLNHPVRYCKVFFVDLDDNEVVDEKRFNCTIWITEDEYAQILADYLHDSRVMITHLRDNYPGVYKTISEHGIKDNHTWSVIFEEIRKDADAILSDRGEEMSKL